MFAVVITEKGGAQRRMDFDKNEVTIGRVQGNDIILPKGNVSKRHSRIVLKDNRFIVVDLKSTNGTYVNGRKITSPLVVKPGDKIYVGDFILTVEETESAGADAGGYAEESGPEAAEAPLPSRASASPPQPPSGPAPAGSSASAPARAAAPPPLPQQRERAPSRPPQPQAPAAAPAAEPAAERYAHEEPAEPPPPPPPQPSPPRPRPRSVEPQPARASGPGTAGQTSPPPAGGAPSIPPEGFEGSLRTIMGRLAASFDVHNLDPYAMHDRGRWEEAHAAIETAVGELQGEGLLDGIDPEELTGAALREAVGLGALEALLGDESVREVVVEGPHCVMADYGNGFQPIGAGFSSSASLYTIARRLMGQAGLSQEDVEPTQQFVLPYGPHVSVILPPVAVRGPVIEVRRVGHSSTGEQLVSAGALSADMLELLKRAIQARRNIAVVGPVGSGVTTALGTLGSLCQEEERIVTAEDVPDLAIDRDHVISLATGGPRSGVTQRDVMRQAMQLRADRMVIDDIRDGAAFEALTVLAARREGCLLGIHGGSADDDPLDVIRVLARLEGASRESVEGLLGRSVHVVVQLGQAEGRRRVLRVAEVAQAGGGLEARDLFVYDGEFTPTGARPSF